MHELAMDWTHCPERLSTLPHDDGAMHRLVQESGSLALAAWHLARVRCGTATRDAPTTREVCTVARELAERTGYFDVFPSRAAIATECARHGLSIGRARG